MGALTRRLALLITLPFAAAVGSPATAQPAPDMWIVSTQAAVDSIRDPETAAIILGNAMDLARERDAQGMRPQLTQLQLMLDCVAMDKFDLCRRVYDISDFKFDVAKFNSGLRDYASVLRSLAAYLLHPVERPPALDKEHTLKMAALEYGAKHYTAIEVAVRRKVASEDLGGLAQAIGLAGSRVCAAR